MNTTRQSGTEHANTCESTRRHDTSGILIVVVCALLVASPYLIMAWRNA